MKTVLLSSALLLTISAWAATPPQDLITMDQALSIAAQARSGKIQSKELEHDNARWVYSVDIQSKDNITHEILIDAKSGKIISQITVPPEQEQAEE